MDERLVYEILSASIRPQLFIGFLAPRMAFSKFMTLVRSNFIIMCSLLG